MSSDSTNSSWKTFSGRKFRRSDCTKPTCRHGAEAELLTSQTETNPTRRFYRFNLRNDADCRYFVWLDPELPPYQKGCYLKLKSQVKSLKEQLRCKQVVEKLLNEMLEMKVKEMDLLKIENDELEKKVTDTCEKGRKEKKLLLFLCLFVLLVCGCLMMG
ncbi:GRF zinc finger containing protein [Striga asiatica]|uniref:GRF zinc finger containing protein n=1 Tax=Striga asiatica TaxID=4170 RepID=A0A5A7P1N0_STRAF|nr:GRF zinc finger containing protein [Striga asiatica]